MHKSFRPKSRVRGGGVVRIVRDSYRKDSGEWDLVKNRVLQRDGYRCRDPECRIFVGKTNLRAVHHILELSAGGRTTEHNLITLCDKCHSKRHTHLRRRWV